MRNKIYIYYCFECGIILSLSRRDYIFCPSCVEKGNTHHMTGNPIIISIMYECRRNDWRLPEKLKKRPVYDKEGKRIPSAKPPSLKVVRKTTRVDAPAIVRGPIPSPLRRSIPDATPADI